MSRSREANEFGSLSWSGKDPYRLVPRGILDGDSVASGRYRITVRPRSGAYLRTQVRLADNRLVAASNPVWFLPKAPPRGVPADRKRSLPAT